MKTIRRKLPPFVQQIDYQGAAYFYFRRPGFQRVKLPGLPWSPEFMAAYEAALAGQVMPIGVGRRKPGSFARAGRILFRVDGVPGHEAINERRLPQRHRPAVQNSRTGTATRSAARARRRLQREHVVKLMAMRARNRRAQTCCARCCAR